MFSAKTAPDRRIPRRGREKDELPYLDPRVDRDERARAREDLHYELRVIANRLRPAESAEPAPATDTVPTPSPAIASVMTPAEPDTRRTTPPAPAAAADVPESDIILRGKFVFLEENGRRVIRLA